MIPMRTWPYGTTKRVRVLGNEQAGDVQLVTCLDLGAPEAFLLMEKVGTIEAAEGDTGTIVFKMGGPTGGHWEFTKDPEKPAP